MLVQWLIQVLKNYLHDLLSRLIQIQQMSGHRIIAKLAFINYFMFVMYRIDINIYFSFFYRLVSLG